MPIHIVSCTASSMNSPYGDHLAWPGPRIHPLYASCATKASLVRIPPLRASSWWQKHLDKLAGASLRIHLTVASACHIQRCRQSILHRRMASVEDPDDRAEEEVAVKRLKKVIIVPGNGDGDVRRGNWYHWLEVELTARNVEVALDNMPDPCEAYESSWLPFITDVLAGSPEELPECLIVGHSSGAVAAMRLAEKFQVGGIVLVAAYDSDLGDAGERASGYFSRPWLWEQQQLNAGCIIQFASTNDPFLNLTTQHAVRDGLSPKVEYFELKGRSHFFEPCQELLDA
eukprot:1282832-Amphidinium_carterae.1